MVQQNVSSKETELAGLQAKIRDLGRKETDLRTEKVVEIHTVKIRSFAFEWFRNFDMMFVDYLVLLLSLFSLFGICCTFGPVSIFSAS